jgi:VanZ family protein
VLGSAGTWAPDRPGIWAPTLVSIQDVAQNVLLYVPFGVLGVLSLKDAYPRHWLRLVVRVVGLAILFSASNEALQLYTIDRVGSLTDIVSAAIGAGVGGVTASMWRPPK